MTLSFAPLAAVAAEPPLALLVLLALVGLVLSAWLVVSGVKGGLNKMTAFPEGTGLRVDCAGCGVASTFDQPYAYHAGHANQGFLYNEAGTLTLVWSSFDPVYESIVGAKHPWALGWWDRRRLERTLKPAPVGGRWRFRNPARCPRCGYVISQPIGRCIYYVVYPGSLVLDGPERQQFGEAIDEGAL